MSAIEWQAIQEACEATREETREETRKEVARNFAAKGLAIGIPLDKVAAITGLSFDELQKLQIPAVS